MPKLPRDKKREKHVTHSNGLDHISHSLLKRDTGLNLETTRGPFWTAGGMVIALTEDVFLDQAVKGERGALALKQLCGGDGGSKVSGCLDLWRNESSNHHPCAYLSIANCRVGQTTSEDTDEGDWGSTPL